MSFCHKALKTLSDGKNMDTNNLEERYANDETFTLNESRSNILLELFGAICLSALAGFFIAACSEILYKNVHILSNVDGSYLKVIAIGTSVAAPLAVLLILDLLLPQKLVFDETGLTRKLLGTKSQMAWSDISKIELKDSSLGETSESKKTIVLSGIYSTLSIMPAFEIPPSKLASYISFRAKKNVQPVPVDRPDYPANFQINARRADINKKILLPISFSIIAILIIGLAALFIWINSVMTR